MLVLFCVRCRLYVPLACTGATDDRSPRTRSDALGHDFPGHRA